MPYTVQPVITGWFGPVRDDILFDGGDPTKVREVPSIIYVIRGEGHMLLVDTGFSSADKCKAVMGLDCRREMPYQLILQQNDVKPQNVDTVIFTHLHWDHAGCAAQYPNARLICQRREKEAALADDMLAPQYREELIEIAPRLETVHGDCTIIPGIEVWLMGGHTPGSQAVQIKTQQGNVVITGDVMMHTHNLTLGIPVGLAYDKEEMSMALARITQSGLPVYPSHEPVAQVYISGAS